MTVTSTSSFLYGMLVGSANKSFQALAIFTQTTTLNSEICRQIVLKCIQDTMAVKAIKTCRNYNHQLRKRKKIVLFQKNRIRLFDTTIVYK